MGRYEGVVVGVEIEAKMKLTEVGDLVARLLKVGATSSRAVIEVNTYFDTPGGTLRSTDCGLRVRVERDTQGTHSQTTVTYKGPLGPGELKTRQEIELAVVDAQAMAQMLAALGFGPVRSFEKRREYWECLGCSVQLDTLPYLGHFVEIEGSTEEAVFEVRRKLGLDGVALIRTGYIVMLESYLAQHGITDTHIPLDAPPTRVIRSD